MCQDNLPGLLKAASVWRQGSSSLQLLKSTHTDVCRYPWIHHPQPRPAFVSPSLLSSPPRNRCPTFNLVGYLALSRVSWEGSQSTHSFLSASFTQCNHSETHPRCWVHPWFTPFCLVVFPAQHFHHPNSMFGGNTTAAPRGTITAKQARRPVNSPFPAPGDVGRQAPKRVEHSKENCCLILRTSDRAVTNISSFHK